jgi:hypothetical protein
MNTQRISRIVGGVAVAAVASVVMVVMWSSMNQSDPAPSVQPSEGRVMGDLTGFVGRVDQKARTVEVAEKLGVRPVTMTVTDDTAITVRGEQRGLRDLKKDLPIRAFYEVRNDVRYVTRIQVVMDDAQAKAASPAEAKPVVAPAARRSATFKAAPSAPAPVVATAPAPAPALAATVAPPLTSAPLVPPIAPAPPLTPVAEAPAPPRQTVSAGGPVAGDSGDGSEAVDWLLRRRR